MESGLRREAAIEFGVLGPLLARGADGPVVLASPKQRALLAVLLLEAAHDVVPAERLIDELWGEEPPATAGKALQVHVSQLRRALGAKQPIVTRPTGYAIELDPVTVDVHRFEAQVDRARRLRAAGDPAGALSALDQGLALWRGAALADVTLLGPGASEATRLEGMRAVAHEERIELELDRGGGAALVPELEALLATHPYRERMHGLLMRALYRAGRQADALDAFRRARALLVEDLGIEPGPELVRLQEAILAQDPALDGAAESVPAPAPAGARRAEASATVPRAASSILGRESELRAALAMIERPDVRLVTLTGTGGIGKTRLALELAARLGAPSRFVELAPIANPERVLPAIGAAVGAETGTEEAVAAALRRQPVVLFLDNFEQVLSAAPAVAGLLRAVEDLHVVVTSRAPLHIAGEHELPLPPLGRDSAVELFLRRAREQDPRFAPDPDALESIAAICGHLEGLPLAIELAAARTRVLTPGQILERIGRRLELLSAGRRDAPERHRTLRATIAWSHELLSRDEQRLFEQLAVFHSGWPLEGAEAVANGPVLDALDALVDHSLVIRDEARFRMLETVREYALERLEASEEAGAVRQRHARWCLELAEAAGQELTGPEQARWFERLDAEQENLRAASAWSVANGEPEIALGLIAEVWRFWLARGAATELRGMLSAALASGRGEPALRAKALNAAGVLAGEADDLGAARAAFEGALELAAALADRRQMARILMNLGVIAMFADDHHAALARYTEAGEIWRELGDVRGQSIMHENLAVVHELMGDFEGAMPLAEESVELARAAGDRLHLASTLMTLGRLLVRCHPSEPRITQVLHEGLQLALELGERLLTIEGLEVVADFAARAGDPARGALLIGAAEAERARAQTERKPDERPFFETTVRQLEQALGKEAYERELARGRQTHLEAAVAVALDLAERLPQPV